MDNRAKPEELEQDINEILEETPNDNIAENEDTPVEDEGIDEQGVNVDEEKDVGSSDEDNQPTLSAEELETEAPTEPDYREKFKASTQEAQILNSKNNKFTDAVEQAAQLTEVEEADLRARYSNWEQMTPTEKELAKENLLNNKRLGMIHSAVLETKKGDEWVGKVDEFLVDDTQIAAYPGLAGREQEFKAFATKPSRVGVDLGDLVSAFLYTSPTPAKGNRKSLLLSGGNSSEFDNKPKKMNEEDAAALRAKSPRAYMEAIKGGKIDVEI